MSSSAISQMTLASLLNGSRGSPTPLRYGPNRYLPVFVLLDLTHDVRILSEFLDKSLGCVEGISVLSALDVASTGIHAVVLRMIALNGLAHDLEISFQCYGL